MAAIISMRDVSLGFGENLASSWAPPRGLSSPLSHERHAPVLTGLDLTVAAGEILVLVGPSGVGKSTLLRAIAGLIKPLGGSITWHQSAGEKQARFGFVFQEARLLPWRRVIDNVAIGLEHRPTGSPRLAKSERLARAQAALALVGLADYGQRWPYQLSGGQKQRVGIARALAIAPQVLLMDEPFAALDEVTRAGLQDELVSLFSKTGKTIIFVTHDLDEAAFLGDRIAVLGLGKSDGAGASSASGRLIRLMTNPHPRRRPVVDENLPSARQNTAQQLAAALQANYEI